jgi:hypothetical protein
MQAPFFALDPNDPDVLLEGNQGVFKCSLIIMAIVSGYSVMIFNIYQSVMQTIYNSSCTGGNTNTSCGTFLNQINVLNLLAPFCYVIFSIYLIFCLVALTGLWNRNRKLVKNVIPFSWILAIAGIVCTFFGVVNQFVLLSFSFIIMALYPFYAQPKLKEVSELILKSEKKRERTAAQKAQQQAMNLV